jgi:hypothetical protein
MSRSPARDPTGRAPTEGLEIAVQDDGVALSGAVAEAGSYAFTILVEAEEGDVCAEWARYDAALTVE